jgi:hypothetical protein
MNSMSLMTRDLDNLSTIRLLELARRTSLQSDWIGADGLELCENIRQ